MRATDKLFLAQPTDFPVSQKANMANADASSVITSVCGDKPFIFIGKKPSVESMTMFPTLQHIG